MSKQTNSPHDWTVLHYSLSAASRAASSMHGVKDTSSNCHLSRHTELPKVPLKYCTDNMSHRATC